MCVSMKSAWTVTGVTHSHAGRRVPTSYFRIRDSRCPSDVETRAREENMSGSDIRVQCCAYPGDVPNLNQIQETS